MSRKMKHNEKLAYKYKFLREKIIQSYRKGCKILDIVKVIFAVIFIVFSIIAMHVCQHNQDKSVWLICWVLLIFLIKQDKSVPVNVVTIYIFFIVFPLFDF